MLLKKPLRSCSAAESDMERRGGGSAVEAGWLNDPVPVPVPLLVVLLPLVSRERGVRMERRRTTLLLVAVVAVVANRTFSTTSTGRESSSLEPCSKSSGSSSMGPSRVDGSAKSEIACAGGIWRVKEDDGGKGSGEEDRGRAGAGLAMRGGVL
jgi:hypothetical protein